MVESENEENGMTQTHPTNQQMQEASTPLVVEEHITAHAPAQRVYEIWRDFTRFPEFMSNVEEVRPVADNRYHWVARIFGVKQEWDAEVTDTTPNSRIAWRSVNGAPNAGTVNFQEREPGLTDVQIVLAYTPP